MGHAFSTTHALSMSQKGENATEGKNLIAMERDGEIPAAVIPRIGVAHSHEVLSG